VVAPVGRAGFVSRIFFLEAVVAAAVEDGRLLVAGVALADYQKYHKMESDG